MPDPRYDHKLKLCGPGFAPVVFFLLILSLSSLSVCSVVIAFKKLTTEYTEHTEKEDKERKKTKQEDETRGRAQEPGPQGFNL